MQSRQNVVEVFSTFVQLESDSFKAWLCEPRLRRSMKNSLSSASASDLSVDFWSLYWHKLWISRSDRLAEQHLLAYIQEVCYFSAQNAAQKFRGTPHTVADFFQIAITGATKAYQGFKQERGCSLKGYVKLRLDREIRDTLRQRKEADACTDWALLRKISKKKLREALGSAGLAPEAIAQYLLAWKCFKQIYTFTQPTATGKLPDPDESTLEKIVQLYNAERYSQLLVATQALDVVTLKQWLKDSVTWLRSYMHPTSISLNVPKAVGETGELLDDLRENQDTTDLLDALIAQETASERGIQQREMFEVLTDAFNLLSDEIQVIGKLYYCQDLGQTEIAKQLGIKQYTISRRLSRMRESLLKTLAKWANSTELHNPEESYPLEDMSLLLEEWLRHHLKD